LFDGIGLQRYKNFLIYANDPSPKTRKRVIRNCLIFNGLQKGVKKRRFSLKNEDFFSPYLCALRGYFFKNADFDEKMNFFDFF
jgi:hypothetical protein